VDFNLYSTFEDAINDTNQWTHCTHHNHVGMPSECGPTERTFDQWSRMFWPSGKQDVAIYIMKNALRSFNRKPISGGVDINSPVLTGNAEDLNDNIYMTAAGWGIYWEHDQFFFLPKTASGDISMKVHVLSMTGPEYSKVGLMVRESLDPKSKRVDCLWMHRQHGIVMQRRTVYGGHTDHEIFKPELDSAWLKLEKLGNEFTCSWSVDGNDWSTVSTLDIDLGDDMKYGLALTSHDQYRMADATLDGYTSDMILDNLFIAYEHVDESLRNDATDEKFEELVEALVEGEQG